MSAAVQAQGLERRYGSLVAVEDLTFAVKAGEILGVLGPNGGVLGLVALGVRVRRGRYGSGPN